MLHNYYNSITMNNSKKFFYSSYYKCDHSLSHGYLKQDLMFYLLNLNSFSITLCQCTACVYSPILKGHRFLDIPHEDYVFWFQLCKTLKSTEILKYLLLQHYIELLVHLSRQIKHKSSLGGLVPFIHGL